MRAPPLVPEFISLTLLAVCDSGLATVCRRLVAKFDPQTRNPNCTPHPSCGLGCGDSGLGPRVKDLGFRVAKRPSSPNSQRQSSGTRNPKPYRAPICRSSRLPFVPETERERRARVPTSLSQGILIPISLSKGLGWYRIW